MLVKVCVDEADESSCFAASFLNVGRPGKFACVGKS